MSFHLSRKGLLGSDCLIVCILLLATAAAALAGGRILQAGRQQAALDTYADKLLARAIEVAADSSQTLQRAHELRTAPCSEADIAELRFLMFQSRFLRDVGRLRDNHVVCSGAWGVIHQAEPLPRPDLQHDGYRFWKATRYPPDPRIVADASAYRDVTVATAPAAFAGMDPPRSGMAALLLSRDGRYTYNALGDVARLQAHVGAGRDPLGRTRQLRRCSSGFNVCAVAYYRPAGLFAESPVQAAGLGLLGALAGIGIGLTIVGIRMRRRSLPMQLQRALEGDGLVMHYQPLRPLRDRRLAGVEALARWCSESGQWVEPDVFVAMAEELHLAGTMARQVVRKALAELGARLRGDDGFYVSLNLSVAEIADPDFHRYLDEQIRHHGIAADRLVLEITERSTTGHAELAESIGRLRERGYRFYIDDFGTGYSTLAYLARLPIDAIKVDRMFTGSIGTGSPVELIIEPICALARRLQVGLVVEGVESEEQAASVLRLAPDALGQGWLLGRPVPAAQLPAD
ncbi:EAL domain-containing protein [Stenotrophomonas sp. MMGLT7]|uniref:EAL domain-containing protein n=1 Tax=Stenotrophomonas sp. MMGLT7 TaxID=2901227 RepID=UPI001E4338BF|nr:EAL domain-containing protein [Stenotrophomonas sp. MMGLT7]MCD7098619.1 EAL domain-containing protein [Stenotrophomonas sp. MMGLT7]